MKNGASKKRVNRLNTGRRISKNVVIGAVIGTCAVAVIVAVAAVCISKGNDKKRYEKEVQGLRENVVSTITNFYESSVKMTNSESKGMDIVAEVTNADILGLADDTNKLRIESSIDISGNGLVRQKNDIYMDNECGLSYETIEGNGKIVYTLPELTSRYMDISELSSDESKQTAYKLIALRNGLSGEDLFEEHVNRYSNELMNAFKYDRVEEGEQGNKIYIGKGNVKDFNEALDNIYTGLLANKLLNNIKGIGFDNEELLTVVNWVYGIPQKIKDELDVQDNSELELLVCNKSDEGKTYTIQCKNGDVCNTIVLIINGENIQLMKSLNNEYSEYVLEKTVTDSSSAIRLHIEDMDVDIMKDNTMEGDIVTWYNLSASIVKGEDKKLYLNVNVTDSGTRLEAAGEVTTDGINSGKVNLRLTRRECEAFTMPSTYSPLGGDDEWENSLNRQKLNGSDLDDYIGKVFKDGEKEDINIKDVGTINRGDYRVVDQSMLKGLEKYEEPEDSGSYLIELTPEDIEKLGLISESLGYIGSGYEKYDKLKEIMNNVYIKDAKWTNEEDLMNVSGSNDMLVTDISRTEQYSREEDDMYDCLTIRTDYLTHWLSGVVIMCDSEEEMINLGTQVYELLRDVDTGYDWARQFKEESYVTYKDNVNGMVIRVYKERDNTDRIRYYFSIDGTSVLK